ncbi:MAG TPA: HIRAN domain-containing protein [Cytophagales bacterium]|nr:HIRAN domain-containing protein [Cytophagales bacterium]
MQTGNMLELVREPANEHDQYAIALHFDKEKIGYIPRESNEILSRLMDAGVAELQAEITHMEPQAKAWENVHIAVYVLKESNDLPDKNPGYLTKLETPEYYTLKHKNDKVSRIYYHKNDSSFYSGEDFYEDMVKHSSNDSVYDLLHQLTPTELEEAVQSGRFVINKNNISKNQSNEPLTRVFDEAVIALDDYFDEKGFVVVNVERLARLSDRISNFVNVLDKQGNKFVEVLLKNI